MIENPLSESVAVSSLRVEYSGVGLRLPLNKVTFYPWGCGIYIHTHLYEHHRKISDLNIYTCWGHISLHTYH